MVMMKTYPFKRKDYADFLIEFVLKKEDIFLNANEIHDDLLRQHIRNKASK